MQKGVWEKGKLSVGSLEGKLSFGTDDVVCQGCGNNAWHCSRVLETISFLVLINTAKCGYDFAFGDRMISF